MNHKTGGGAATGERIVVTTIAVRATEYVRRRMTVALR